jgi:5,6-dimethylbenzimidazole synthase
MWLTSRALGLGLGWVSILDPDKLTRDLDIPPEWSLVAYLCLGWPVDVSQTPELETLNWEKRRMTLPVENR